MVHVEIAIDREMCQGARQCSHVAPAVFDHEADGTAVVVDPLGAPVEKTLEAAEMCPNLAITLTVDGKVLHEGL